MIPRSDTGKNLAEIVNERPFPEFEGWWELGSEFVRFMSSAIIKIWYDLLESEGDLQYVHDLVGKYLHLVYKRKPRPDLVSNFVSDNCPKVIHSGEFDALSYAFYRSVFEFLAETHEGDEAALVSERRNFTIRVGKLFFNSIYNHLQLNLPPDLRKQEEFNLLKYNLNRVGEFLLAQGYLRGHCEFTFSLDVKYNERRITQTSRDFLQNLIHKKIGYALYIMGYPVILPSAVYLYQLFGEAQHHSSRTIEELFERIGYKASEADDFNPSNYPSDRVVELWSISR